MLIEREKEYEKSLKTANKTRILIFNKQSIRRVQKMQIIYVVMKKFSKN